ncbi:deaminase domain-containing protein [Pseudomonas sp. P2757]|uniref:deaminase domain-containing protein n=1 Tax=unclassified Pseudomonas TaxID=196821 RepID=UPI003B5A3D6E
MQPPSIPQTELSAATSSPSFAQRHHALEAEYKELLVKLRQAPSLPDALTHTFIKPQLSSPLELDAREGTTALQTLLKDKVFKQICARVNASPSHLMLTMTGDKSLYEGQRTDSLQRVTLSLAEIPEWRSHSSRIETAARKTGGQIRADGYFSLAKMALYYGMAPWNRVDETAHQASIHWLQEKLARHSLQLDCGVNIDSLTHPASATDRKALALIRAVAPEQNMSMDKLLLQTANARIIDAVRSFLPSTQTSLISYLMRNIAAQTTVEQIRTTPTVYLEKILQSPDASRLAQALLEKLEWFGASPDQETSAFVRYKLLSRAIRTWGRQGDDLRTVAGYDWQQRWNYGKSYQAIWSQFERHLLRSERAATQREAILLARLYRCEFPSDFHVRDVPPDLSYRSSPVWVNYVQGLTLAEVLQPERVPDMTFQQLVDFAAQSLKTATAQERDLIMWSRIAPAVDWAISNGIVQEEEDYVRSDEIHGRALKALDEHIRALKAAIVQMDVDYPLRRDIADEQIRKVFGWDVFTRDGRKLIRDYGQGDGARSGPKDPPDFKSKSYAFRDVYMWNRHHTCGWFITLPDGQSRSTSRFSIDANGNMKTTAKWIPDIVIKRKLPDVNKLFAASFNTYLSSTKDAYKTLLMSLFTQLPHDDRQAMEYGETRIFTLRAPTKDLEFGQETPALTKSLRLRMGFILRLNEGQHTCWYECLPRAGIIRRLPDFSPGVLNGRKTTEDWRLLGGSATVEVLRGREVPFDWDAHENGRIPKKDATCNAIIDQFGEAFRADPSSETPPRISSTRTAKIAAFIANDLFYFDDAKLLAAARQETELERRESKGPLLGKLLKFLPFFGNVDDLDSDNPNKRIAAVFGMYTDSVSFFLPLGKFISGTAKLAGTAARLGFKSALPEFSSLSRKLLVSSLQNFNPLDGVPTLVAAAARGLYAATRFALKSAAKGIEKIARKTGQYDFINGIPQLADSGHYRLLSGVDDLASVKGVDNVPVRNIADAGAADYRVIDPLAGKPFGPTLGTKMTLGRTAYLPTQTADGFTIVEVAQNSRIRQIMEVDGSQTTFIDDAAYRLDQNVLRRTDTIDTTDRLTALPCRIRRAGGDDCMTRYVTRTPAPTPADGTFDTTKGWALWFGDTVYIPAPGRPNLTVNGLRARAHLKGKVDFRKGIYARVDIRVTSQGDLHTFKSGAIIVESMDGAKQYVFARLDAAEFYVAELPIQQSLSDALTFNKASSLAADLREELLTVYTGSINANNMARIYGVDTVERALKTMNDIAIPIGGHVNPPDTLKLLKVDTSPGEAVLFDHSTRMIVSTLPAGATSWSRSRDASQTFRQRSADIFDTLFASSTINVRPNADLRINATMAKFQKLLPRRFRAGNPRNIAFADIVTTTGAREVYVSVSGAQGLTSELPLFKNSVAPGNVIVGDTTYFNIDFGQTFSRTSLNLSSDGKVLAIPHTIKNIETYTPALTTRPTSLDSEAKLISVIRAKYPDSKDIQTIDVATTMPPCNSCSVVIKEFGHNGASDALQVLWK